MGIYERFWPTSDKLSDVSLLNTLGVTVGHRVLLVSAYRMSEKHVSNFHLAGVVDRESMNSKINTMPENIAFRPLMCKKIRYHLSPDAHRQESGRNKKMVCACAIQIWRDALSVMHLSM